MASLRHLFDSMTERVDEAYREEGLQTATRDLENGMVLSR